MTTANGVAASAPKKGKRRIFTDREKHALVVQFHTRPPGETAEEFYQRHGLSQSTFYLWNKNPKFRRGTHPTKAERTAVASARRGRPPKPILAMPADASELERLRLENRLLRACVAYARSQGLIDLLELFDLPRDARVRATRGKAGRGFA